MSNRNLILAAAGQIGGDYQISRSLRFNSADSAYLSRTPASASNRKTWTWSFWIKLAKTDASYSENWFAARTGAGGSYTLFYRTNDKIAFLDNQGASLQTTALYRDPSAWYHIVLACDTTQATASNRLKLYVNGTQVTAFSTETYPSQNADLNVNTTDTFLIGQNDSTLHPNVYMADINFIDGQALTPSSFGEVDETTGVWKPIRYAGTYGTNGFYLDFSDNTSTTTLGYDAAGSNDWTLNNFSVAAGAGNDSLVDSPTRYGDDTGAGGEVRGNYCTLNPLDSTSGMTFSNGNLQVVATSANWYSSLGTIGVSSGKWYWEQTLLSGVSVFVGLGRAGTNLTLGNFPGKLSDTYGVQGVNGYKYNNNSSSAYMATFTANDVIGVAFDADARTLTFYKNGVSQGVAFSSIPDGVYMPMGGVVNDPIGLNFGQRPFAHTAPSGFKALCTTNLPDSTVVQGDDYFNTVLYTGTGSSLGVTGVGFQPDFTWIKERSGAADHGLYDAVRGVQNQLESNTTDAETTEATGLTAFGTDGFTVGALAQLNTSADTYVAWNWNAGGSNATNTDGTITSTVRANTTAGFSIVSYTGNGVDGATVGHGLNTAPSMVIFKNRIDSGQWNVIFPPILGAGYWMPLNGTDAAVFFDSDWTTTSSVISLSNGGGHNGSGDAIIAYAFAEVEGFSKFGSYTGNGSTDGTFVYTGFRPRWILYKPSNRVATDWVMWDTARNPYNIASQYLLANTSGAEGSVGVVDILSNGFKLRVTSTGNNGSGDIIVYAAFAENPFKNSLAR